MFKWLPWSVTDNVTSEYWKCAIFSTDIYHDTDTSDNSNRNTGDAGSSFISRHKETWMLFWWRGYRWRGVRVCECGCVLGGSVWLPSIFLRRCWWNSQCELRTQQTRLTFSSTKHTLNLKPQHEHTHWKYTKSQSKHSFSSHFEI